MSVESANLASHPATREAAARPGARDLNPSGIGFLALLKEDLRTHGGDRSEQGYQAIRVHRFGNWRMGQPKLFRLVLSPLYRWLFKRVERTCGITLPYTVQLGRRVRLWHHGGMILHAARIGDDVHIRQNTTFGIARKDALHQLPVIEDRADIGCGVVILGAVTVGHDSVIGANAVVVKDVPPFSVAVGIPAKVIKRVASGQLPVASAGADAFAGAGDSSIPAHLDGPGLGVVRGISPLATDN